MERKGLLGSGETCYDVWSVDCGCGWKTGGGD